MSNLLKNIDISKVTIENSFETLPPNLFEQVSVFFPPSGSFDSLCLQRYLKNLIEYEEEDCSSSMSLTNQLRLAFSDMTPDTICGKFPQAELALKRRLRCVAEYLIRSKEFDKLKNEKGQLIKRRGVIGKLVCVYKPLPKLLESLKKQGLLNNEQTRKVIVNPFEK